MKKALIIIWLIILGGLFFLYQSTYSSINTNNHISKNPTESDPLAINENFPNLMKIGQQAYDNKNFPQAIRYFQSAVKSNPQSRLATEKLGLSYLAYGQAEKALMQFNKIAQTFPEDLKNQANIIQALLNTREIEKAQIQLQKIISPESPTAEKAGQNKDIIFFRVTLAILFKDYKQAADLIRKELNKKKENQVADERLQKYQEKFSLFDTFREGDPLFLQTLLAKALIENAQYEASIRYLFDIINQNASYKAPWLLLGYSYLQTKNYKDAFEAFNQANTLAPNDGRTLYYLGLTKLQMKEPQTSLLYFEQAKENGYTTPLFQTQLAEVYSQNKEYGKAEAIYENLLQKGERNLSILYKTAEIQFEYLNKKNRAKKIAEVALELYPENYQAYELMGRVLISQGEKNQGLTSLIKATKLNPQASTYYYLGIFWLNEEKNKNAVKYFLEAYKQDPQSPFGEISRRYLQKLQTY